MCFTSIYLRKYNTICIFSLLFLCLSLLFSFSLYPKWQNFSDSVSYVPVHQTFEYLLFFSGIS